MTAIAAESKKLCNSTKLPESGKQTWSLCSIPGLFVVWWSMIWSPSRRSRVFVVRPQLKRKVDLSILTDITVVHPHRPHRLLSILTDITDFCPSSQISQTLSILTDITDFCPSSQTSQTSVHSHRHHKSYKDSLFFVGGKSCNILKTEQNTNQLWTSLIDTINAIWFPTCYWKTFMAVGEPDYLILTPPGSLLCSQTSPIFLLTHSNSLHCNETSDNKS